MGKSTPFSSFKKDVENDNVFLELIERYGKVGCDIPERLQGIRKVDRVTSSAVVLVDKNCVESKLSYKTTKLFSYDGKYFCVYNPGQRDLTNEESLILKEAETLYKGSFWDRELFLKKSACPWLSNYSVNKSKICLSNGKVLDNCIVGDLILKYRVIKQCNMI